VNVRNAAPAFRANPTSGRWAERLRCAFEVRAPAERFGESSVGWSVVLNTFGGRAWSAAVAGAGVTTGWEALDALAALATLATTAIGVLGALCEPVGLPTGWGIDSDVMCSVGDVPLDGEVGSVGDVPLGEPGDEPLGDVGSVGEEPLGEVGSVGDVPLGEPGEEPLGDGVGSIAASPPLGPP